MSAIDPAMFDQARDRLRDGARSRYLTVLEVAELARCEQKTVRRAIHSGRLRAFRPAQKLLVREQDARAWVESAPVTGPSTRPRSPARRRQPPGSVADLREMERQATTSPSSP